VPGDGCPFGGRPRQSFIRATLPPGIEVTATARHFVPLPELVAIEQVFG
jgi:hypothetical protein